MARAKVYSQTMRLKENGRMKTFRYWCFTIHGWNGTVLSDNGYGSQQAALADADKLARAVGLIENRGHKLPTWRDVVDAASRRS